jgi:hypothetical protein
VCSWNIYHGFVLQHSFPADSAGTVIEISDSSKRTFRVKDLTPMRKKSRVIFDTKDVVIN